MISFFIPIIANVPMTRVDIPDATASTPGLVTTGQSGTLPYRTITPAMSPYTFVAGTDCVLGCDTTDGITIQFPDGAPAGTLLITTDITGNAAAKNVLGLRPPGGQVQNTSGAGTFVILSVNNQSFIWICRGSNKWNAIAQF